MPVERPITSVVMISVSRLPILSPMWPNSDAAERPHGQADAERGEGVSVPDALLVVGKNRSPNTSAAAVP